MMGEITGEARKTPEGTRVTVEVELNYHVCIKVTGARSTKRK